MTKIKDTDYLYLSAMIRSLEPNLLDRRRMERMIEARSDEDALGILSECGYGGMESVSMDNLELLLSRNRREVLAEFRNLAPDSKIVDIFQMKYDYHNIKALIKCQAMSVHADSLLINAGRIDTKTLTDAVNQSEFQKLPIKLRDAAISAIDILAATSDPQAADIELDRAYFNELLETAIETGSDFLMGYVRLVIDSSNLKSTVRTIRMDKGADFLNRVLSDGGNIETGAITTAFLSGGSLEALYSGSLLEGAASEADMVKKGGSLTGFERQCDNAVTAYLNRAKTLPFGEGVLVAYLAAKETEISSVRIIMAGRKSGLPPESIRERLRESYV